MTKKNQNTLLLLAASTVLALVFIIAAVVLLKPSKKAPTPLPQPSAKVAEEFPFEPSPMAGEELAPEYEPTGPCEFGFAVSYTCQEQVNWNISEIETPLGLRTQIIASASIQYSNVELRVIDIYTTQYNYAGPTPTGTYDWTWVIDVPLSNIQRVEFWLNVPNPGSGLEGEICGIWLAPSPSISPSPSVSPSPPYSPSPSPSVSPSPPYSPSPSPSPSYSPSPSPSPSSPPWLRCEELGFYEICPSPTYTCVPYSGQTPTPNDQVNFYCQSVGSVSPDTFEFRYFVNGVQQSNLWLERYNPATDCNTAGGTVTCRGYSNKITIVSGSYLVQCRVCRLGQCTTWGQAN